MSNTLNVALSFVGYAMFTCIVLLEVLTGFCLDINTTECASHWDYKVYDHNLVQCISFKNLTMESYNLAAAVMSIQN